MDAANTLQPCSEEAGGINKPCFLFFSSNSLLVPPIARTKQETGGQTCSFDAVLRVLPLRAQGRVGKGATWMRVMVVVVQIETTQHIVFGQFLNTKQTTSVKQ